MKRGNSHRPSVILEDDHRLWCDLANNHGIWRYSCDSIRSICQTLRWLCSKANASFLQPLARQSRFTHVLTFADFLFGKQNFVPHHFNSLLRIHRQIGGIDAWNVTLSNLNESLDRITGELRLLRPHCFASFLPSRTWTGLDVDGLFIVIVIVVVVIIGLGRMFVRAAICRWFTGSTTSIFTLENSKLHWWRFVNVGITTSSSGSSLSRFISCVRRIFNDRRRRRRRRKRARTDGGWMAERTVDQRERGEEGEKTHRRRARSNSNKYLWLRRVGGVHVRGRKRRKRQREGEKTSTQLFQAPIFVFTFNDRTSRSCISSHLIWSHRASGRASDEETNVPTGNKGRWLLFSIVVVVIIIIRQCVHSGMKDGRNIRIKAGFSQRLESRVEFYNEYNQQEWASRRGQRST